MDNATLFRDLKPMLGKRPRKYDRRTFQLKRYLTPLLPSPPAAIGYGNHLAKIGMMLNGPNDFSSSSLTARQIGLIRGGLGDCTIAAPAHGIQIWTQNTRGESTVPDSKILSLYEKWCGFNPSDPLSDRGGVMLDIMNNWRKEGFGGYPLDGFAAIDTGGPDAFQLNRTDLMTSIWLFGGINVGLALPITAQNQAVWRVPSNPGPDDVAGSWGLHDVWVDGYNQNVLSCKTWGVAMLMTWGWLMTYCDEAYAPFSRLWFDKAGISHSGFDWATLETDLSLVKSVRIT